MPSEESERPCTPRKRLIAAQQEDRDVGFRITTLGLSSSTTAIGSIGRQSSVRDFSAEYVQRVLQTAITTPQRS